MSVQTHMFSDFISQFWIVYHGIVENTEHVNTLLAECWSNIAHVRSASRCDSVLERLSANVGTMLAQRLRRWPNIVPTVAERFVFAGLSLASGGFAIGGWMTVYSVFVTYTPRLP